MGCDKDSYHYRYTSQKNKNKKQSKICPNTFSQVEEVLFFKASFFSNPYHTEEIEVGYFFGFKIDYTQSYESWLILMVSVFLATHTKK